MKHYDGQAFNGIPVVVSERLEPGQSAIVNPYGLEGMDVLVLHPTMDYGMRMSQVGYGDLEHLTDPEVMVAASVQWQTDVIERRAAWSERLIDLLTEGAELRQAISADNARIRMYAASAARAIARELDQ